MLVRHDPGSRLWNSGTLGLWDFGTLGHSMKLSYSFLILIFVLYPTPCQARSVVRDFLTFITLDSLKRPRVTKRHRVEENFDDEPINLPWVKDLVHNYPELSWFATREIDLGHDGMYHHDANSWSYRIWGEQYPEFDRAVLRIWALRAIYKGNFESYCFFVRGQPSNSTLTHSAFIDLHIDLNRLLESFPTFTLKRKKILEALEIFLVLSDIGKSHAARAKARSHGIFDPSHSDFFRTCLAQCPHIFPSLARISFPYQEIIIKASAATNLEHVCNIEGNTTVFQHYNDFPLEKPFFNFAFMAHVCSCAAKKSYQRIDGCRNFDQNMHQSMQAVYNLYMQNPHQPPHLLYKKYLALRARWLGLDINIPEERVLARVGAMIDLVGVEKGRMLKQAFAKLDVRLQALVISQFDPRNKDQLLRTPLHITSILNNMIEHKSLGYNFQERLEKTLVLSLPFVAQVLKEHREYLRSNAEKSFVPLNFNQIARAIKDNPFSLNYVQYQLDAQHNVIPF